MVKEERTFFKHETMAHTHPPTWIVIIFGIYSRATYGGLGDYLVGCCLLCFLFKSRVFNRIFFSLGILFLLIYMRRELLSTTMHIYISRRNICLLILQTLKFSQVYLRVKLFVITDIWERQMTKGIVGYLPCIRIDISNIAHLCVSL